LQPIASDAWFCWRVLDGPDSRDRTAATRPAAPAAVLRLWPQVSRKLGHSGSAALAAALAGAMAFVCLTDGGRYARETGPLVREIDRLAELAGFGLRQVSVTGHRFTPDDAIFDAFDPINVRSQLRFDSVAVRERIERLPWVDTASITRILPDQISVRIVERTPFAVWQRGSREMLIDANGRELAPADGLRRDLPRVAGAGAPAEAGEILALIGKHPEVLGRLEVATRVGERRWTLRLKSGPEVHLPAGGVPEALAQLMAAHARHRLLEQPYTIIDMRSDERIAVRRAFSGDLASLPQPRREQAVP
jgi:cell division protein FtsQ